MSNYCIKDSMFNSVHNSNLFFNIKVPTKLQYLTKIKFIHEESVEPQYSFFLFLYMLKILKLDKLSIFKTTIFKLLFSDKKMIISNYI